MGRLTLVFGNRNYSSWSMRAWLVMRQYLIEFEEFQIPLCQPNSLARKLTYSHRPYL
jgi:glutathione S-transferase